MMICELKIVLKGKHIKQDQMTIGSFVYEMNNKISMHF